MSKPKFRLLRVGEIIKEGDEVRLMDDLDEIGG